MSEQRLGTGLAEGKVWQFGEYWTAHARHPITKAWIRVYSLDTEGAAVVEADALCWRLDREYDEAEASRG